MKRILLLFGAVVGAAILVARAGAATDWMAKTDSAVIQATEDGGTAEFLVVLTEQPDLSAARSVAGKEARGRAVYETMTAFAARTQAPLRALLDARGASYRPYWVHNMIWVRGGRDLVQLLAARPEVLAVRANTAQRVGLPDPAPNDPPDATEGYAGTDSSVDTEWNIAYVRAPEVWAAGAMGQGAVIGGQDTGYDWQHEALQDTYRGWDGAAADHDYNWHDAIHKNNPQTPPGNPCGFDSPEPCDDQSHGTHTMGTMVGATPDRRIGMAPGARWIGCRNMEQGWGTPATYSECYEWFIAPYPISGDPFTDGDPSQAPHVINNSWSCPVNEGCNAPDILRAVVEAVRAAGIVTVHSAGNSGPDCSSVSTPAGTHDASFTVGATTANYDWVNDLWSGSDEIAGFSSRGPVTVDGSNRLKPDIVAPGVGIESTIPGDDYGLNQGTSMAAPHVAGLVALLVSADPALAGDVDALEAVITTSAVPLTSDQGCGDDTPASVPNNVYGWGRIDALAAYETLDLTPARYQSFVPAVVLR